MNTSNFLTILFELCIIPILGILTKWLVSFIQQKMNEAAQKTDNELADKYLGMLSNTISKCVIATNQTYVETLKKEGKFDLAAQKEAFDMTKDAVLTILEGDALNYLNVIIGDLDTYIDKQIEANVNLYKNNWGRT